MFELCHAHAPVVPVSLFLQTLTCILPPLPQEAAAPLASSGGPQEAAPLTFLDVAGSSVRFEVSRAFAAMLQLINNRYVCERGQCSYTSFIHSINKNLSQ